MPRNDSGLILALDLGTSSARAQLLDPSAAPVPDALARHKVEPSYTSDGAATLDLDDYVDGLFGCLDQLAGRLDGVEYIVMSSQWHSIVAFDNESRPLTPIVPWTDTRSVPRRAGDDFDEHAFHTRTGPGCTGSTGPGGSPGCGPSSDRRTGSPACPTSCWSGSPASG